jgi:hypothetical protein
MGFHKRIISKEIILNLYQNYGVDSIISYISKPEILICSDEFSEKIINFIYGDITNDKIKSNIEFEIITSQIKDENN